MVNLITSSSSQAYPSSRPLDRKIYLLLKELDTDIHNPDVLIPFCQKAKKLGHLVSETLRAYALKQDRTLIRQEAEQTAKDILTGVKSFLAIQNGLKEIFSDPTKWDNKTLTQLRQWKKFLVQPVVSRSLE